MDNANKIKIYTVLRDGEGFHPEVLNGILNQNISCILTPITTEGSKNFSEINKINNLKRAIKNNKENFIILMDSDVVLADKNIINDLIDGNKNLFQDIIVCTTKKEILNNCNYIPHALMLLKNDKINELNKFLENYKIKTDEKQDCVICRFLWKNKFMSLQNPLIYEIKP